MIKRGVLGTPTTNSFSAGPQESLFLPRELVRNCLGGRVAEEQEALSPDRPPESVVPTCALPGGPVSAVVRNVI